MTKQRKRQTSIISKCNISPGKNIPPGMPPPKIRCRSFLCDAKLCIKNAYKKTTACFKLAKPSLLDHLLDTVHYSRPITIRHTSLLIVTIENTERFRRSFEAVYFDKFSVTEMSDSVYTFWCREGNLPEYFCFARVSET